MSMEFAPSSRPPGPDCIDRAAWGSPSAIVPQYIAKIRIENEDDYPKQDACTPYYYSAAKIDDFIITNSLTGDCDITITGNIVASEVTASGITLTSRKAFDIPHPTKNGYRLRHICMEGPESGVYFRGRVTNRNEISYPSYWKGLVDWTTVTVNLTPVGSHQNVIVKRFDDEKIYLQSHGGMPIDCFYHVYGERMDGERLIVEYEGKSIEDYPGDNGQYSHNR